MLVQQQVLEAIRTLNRERGVTVMITRHDMPDLEQLRAWIVLLNAARSRSTGRSMSCVGG